MYTPAGPHLRMNLFQLAIPSALGLNNKSIAKVCTLPTWLDCICTFRKVLSEFTCFMFTKQLGLSQNKDSPHIEKVVSFWLPFEAIHKGYCQIRQENTRARHLPSTNTGGATGSSFPRCQFWENTWHGYLIRTELKPVSIHLFVKETKQQACPHTVIASLPALPLLKLSFPHSLNLGPAILRCQNHLIICLSGRQSGHALLLAVCSNNTVKDALVKERTGYRLDDWMRRCFFL